MKKYRVIASHVITAESQEDALQKLARVTAAKKELTPEMAEVAIDEASVIVNRFVKAGYSGNLEFVDRITDATLDEADMKTRLIKGRRLFLRKLADGEFKDLATTESDILKAFFDCVNHVSVKVISEEQSVVESLAKIFAKVKKVVKGKKTIRYYRLKGYNFKTDPDVAELKMIFKKIARV